MNDGRHQNQMERERETKGDQDGPPHMTSICTGRKSSHSKGELNVSMEDQMQTSCVDGPLDGIVMGPILVRIFHL